MNNMDASLMRGHKLERGPTLENGLDVDPFAGSYITGEDANA